MLTGINISGKTNIELYQSIFSLPHHSMSISMKCMLLQYVDSSILFQRLYHNQKTDNQCMSYHVLHCHKRCKYSANLHMQKCSMICLVQMPHKISHIRLNKSISSRHFLKGTKFHWWNNQTFCHSDGWPKCAALLNLSNSLKWMNKDTNLVSKAMRIFTWLLSWIQCYGILVDTVKRTTDQ